MKTSIKINAVFKLSKVLAAMAIGIITYSLPLEAADQDYPIPVKDPAYSNPPQLLESVQGVHPRVMINAEKITQMRQFVNNNPYGQELFEKLEKYARACKPLPLDKVDFTTDDTNAQREGFWKLPTIALHYLLTDSEQSKQWTIGHLEVLLQLDQWQAKGEIDSGMGAGNVMVGAALAYDWLYNDLDPEFREKFRKKLIYQARRMYYLGHQMGQETAHYWQNDPHNNHRWHRDAGLATAVLAAYEGNPADNWILAKTYDELKFIAKWLPEDGTSHESSSYLIFGGNHLTVAMDAADSCWGTDYLMQPFFESVPQFRVQLLRPGLDDAFHFGDSGGLGSYNNFTLKTAGDHGLKNEQAALLAMEENNSGAFWLAWFSIIWYNPEVEGGSIADLPKNTFYPDLGMAFMRDGWEKNDVGMMFKCGPYGGHKLNEYRNQNSYHYINVAHDDPDANSFLLHLDGELVAETSRYAYPKLTSSHNTILVNGKGQKQDGSHWTQPASGKDMSDWAVVTTYKDDGDVVVIEGEAGGSYPDLTRYRRAIIWVKGSYILVLDDISARNNVDITWLMQSESMKAQDSSGASFVMAKGNAQCDFYVVTPDKLSQQIVTSTANGRGKSLGWQQLQLTANNTKQLRMATVFNPWHQSTIAVQMANTGRDQAAIQIKGDGFTDVWKWQSAKGTFTPAIFAGDRENGFKVRVGGKDRAPK